MANQCRHPKSTKTTGYAECDRWTCDDCGEVRGGASGFIRPEIGSVIDAARGVVEHVTRIGWENMQPADVHQLFCLTFVLNGALAELDETKQGQDSYCTLHGERQPCSQHKWASWPNAE
jgi:hypothetical protein